MQLFLKFIVKFHYQAGMVKLVDTLDLGSSAVRLGGSSPSTRTQLKKQTNSDGIIAIFDFLLENPYLKIKTFLKINNQSIN